MSRHVRISVAMVTYNGAAFIREQLETILRALERYPDAEIVVSDDRSVDETLAVVRACAGTSVRIVENPGPRGILSNVENALRACRGDFVFLSDQDDAWMPDRVAATLAFFEQYDVVVCDCSLIDGKGALLAPSYFRLHRSRSGLLYNFLRNHYLGCCMAFRRTVLDYALPFPKGLPMHDIWIGLTSELFGCSYFHPEPLVQYRRHGANLSSTGEKSRNSLATIVRMRLEIAGHLSARIVRVWAQAVRRRLRRREGRE